MHRTENLFDREGFCGDASSALMMLRNWKQEELAPMKLKGNLIMGLLAGAMLALPMTAPALAEPSYNTNSNHIQRVDWWWDHYRSDRDGYANHGWHKGYYEYGGRRNPCERARGLQQEVWRDRNTGHPAAAKDIQEEADAARAKCYNRD